MRASLVWSRRHRVQTSSFSPFMTATCRFASKRRRVWTFEGLTFDPKAAVFPQVIRGLKEAFASVDRVGNRELRSALDLARRYAHEAVTAPAPGTMLTVTVAIDAAADDDSGDLAAMVRRVTDAASEAVARTQQ